LRITYREGWGMGSDRSRRSTDPQWIAFHSPKRREVAPDCTVCL